MSTGSERFYRAAWRLHFYAGLFCIPFILWLAVTGSIYLFKPQIDALIDGPYDHLAVTAPAAGARAQVATALRTVPGSTFNAYELPQTPQSAVRVLVGRGDDVTRVYVHPQTLRVLKVVSEQSRFENVVFHLHGELLLGDRGSMIVELAASWAIIMILTGLYLWWPREARGLGGVLYPRALAGRRFWRDLHGVTGFWVSLFALLFLVSGLPWTASWGKLLTGAEAAVTRLTTHDWPTGSGSERAARIARNTRPAAASGSMASMPGMASKAPTAATASRFGAIGEARLDLMISSVDRLRLAPPVLISPPSAAVATWTGHSDAEDLPLRTTVVLNPTTGAIVSRTSFKDQTPLDRLVSIGIAAHEGQLFGYLNQFINLCAAVALIVVVTSAVIMWWMRRPANVLGAPRSLPAASYSTALIAAIVAIGIFLPFFGVSLVLVVVAERIILRRVPPIRLFLGLA